MTQAQEVHGGRRPPAPLARRLKRGIDAAVAGIGLVVLSPILGAVALAIRLRMGPPVIFRQGRPGFRCTPFTLLKFRTLKNPFEIDGVAVPESELVTGLGQFLRRTSLDELPQLVNIVKGDMSLVGPRPLTMDYLPRYSETQLRRHDVPPGLTGWAQVHGRHALSWDERFRHDLWYIDNWSLWLDFRILGMTARRMFSGASSTPPATADFGYRGPEDQPS